MDQTDLEKFRQAIDLSQTGAKAQAHYLLRELSEAHPTNGNVLLWLAYTASDLMEARTILDKAATLDHANVDIVRAQRWLSDQEKQRLGKRFRQEITGAFVPPIPHELKTTIPPALSVVRSVVPVPPSPQVPAQSAAGNFGPSKSALKANKPAKVKPINTPVIKSGRSLVWWGKILVGVVLLLVVAGGLLLITPVRDIIFDSGPLTLTERNYGDAISEINNLATLKINAIYNCIVTTNSKTCTLDTGYKQAYIDLGNVRDQFQALKSPSKRFESVYTSLDNAYTSLGNISAFSLESMNQHQMLANQAELLTRLDNGRKLLEQGKAELKSLQQLYAGKK